MASAIMFKKYFCSQTHSDRGRHVSNRCDINKVAKVVHGNRSEIYCNRSDALPPVLPELC